MGGHSYAWTRVDRTRWPKNLSGNDVCFFYYEYTPRQSRQFSQANTVVLNYKATRSEIMRNPDLAERKQESIRLYASILGDFFESKYLRDSGLALSQLGQQVGLVPIPPSQLPGSTDYDDRNVRTCTLLSQRYRFKVCRDVETTTYVGPSHLSDEPRNVERTYASLELVGTSAQDCKLVFVVDDVLASGEHYAAVRRLLREAGYSMFMCGMFLARIP